MKHSTPLVLLSVISVATLLAGCSGTAIKDTKLATASAIKQTQSLNQSLNGPNTSLISHSSAPFLASTVSKVALSKPLPKIFSQKTSIQSGTSKTLTAYLNDLGGLSGLDVQLTSNAKDYLSNASNKGKRTAAHTELKVQQGDANSQVKDSTKTHVAVGSKRILFSAAGSLKSVLDRLTGRFGLYWRYDDMSHKVVIFRTQDKTFYLNLLPDSIESSSSIGASDANTKSNVTYSQKKHSGFDQAIKGIAGLGGTILTQNETYGMVSVEATPPVLKVIDHFVKTLNGTAGQGVMIKLSVYDVKVGRDSNYGINWDAIYKVTAGSLAWSTKNLSPALGSSLVTATATGSIGSGPFKGSSLIASALQTYTDSTYVTGDKFFSLDGQSNPIADTEQIAYLKQVSVTSLGSSTTVSSDNVQVSAEPATLQVGYIFNVTPKIVSDDTVRIHLSLDMSTLVKMVERSFGSKDNPQTIDLPDVKHKKLIQTFSLKNGQTAVISGFTTDVNQVGTNSLGDKAYWKLAGSQQTNHEKRMTVIIVTPYIVGEQHG